MDTCCCAVDSSYSGPDAFTEKIVKARKEHKCCECGETIKKGEYYERASGIWDGIPDRFKTCLICAKIRNEYCCNGFYYEELRETLWECLEVELV